MQITAQLWALQLRTSTKALVPKVSESAVGAARPPTSRRKSRCARRAATGTGLPLLAPAMSSYRDRSCVVIIMSSCAWVPTKLPA